MPISYILFTLAALLVLVPWLWRYKIKPYYGRKALRRLISPRIEKNLQLLVQLYRGVPAQMISNRERKRLGYTQDSMVYGEIDFLSFMLLLEKLELKTGEIFYDLGSGSGKAVLTAALSHDFAKVYGIELLPGLYRLSETQLNKAKDLAKKESQNLAPVAFIQADFLEQDLSEADVIFANATCLSYYQWEKLVEKLSSLKPGSRVMVTTKKINNDYFILKSSNLELMSWGMNSVNIYQKR